MAQQRPGTYTINLPNGGKLDVQANNETEAIAGAQSWYAQQNPQVLSTPIQNGRPQGSPGIAGGLNDAWQSLVSGTSQLGQGLGGLDRAVFGDLYQSDLFKWERDMAQGAENLQGRAEGRQSAQRQWAQENNPWYTPDNLLHAGLTSIPSMIPSAIAGVGGFLAGGPLGAATAATAVEGAMGAGSVNDAIVDDLTARGFGETEAARAARLPSLGAGAVTGAIGRLLPTSRFADDLIAGRISSGLASGAARGLASEGIEEGLQSANEQLGQNIGVKTLVPETGLLDNVGQAGMQGAVLGGLMGGTIGGVAGAGNNETSRTRVAQEQLGEDMLTEEQMGAEWEAQRAAAATPTDSVINQGTDPSAPSLIDRSQEGLPTPGVPAGAQAAVDERSYRESLAPVMNDMMQGNYEELLRASRQEGSLKPDKPIKEEEIQRDLFTPEMAAEVARASYEGPVSASLLASRGVSNASDTLEILARRGHIRKVGEQSVQLPTRKGDKTRSVKEPVYESTVPKPVEVAGPGQETELSIRPVPSEIAPGARQGKAPSPEAIQVREERALRAERTLREQLAALPQLPEDATQAQIDRRDQKVQAIEAQLQDAEVETARARTGRADFAVVEKIRDPETGVVREQVVQAFPNRKEAETYLGAAKQGPVGEAVTSEQVVAAKAKAKEAQATVARKDAFRQRARTQLGAQLKGLGLGDKAVLEVSDRLVDAVAGPVEGYVDVVARTAEGDASKVVMALGLEHYDPNLTEDQLLDKVAQTLNHEGIHALRRLGVFKDAEWSALVKQTQSLKMRGREYTYAEWAQNTYDGVPGYDTDAILEEAVAEMYKDWNAGGRKLGPRYTGLFNKIAAFFRSLFKQMSAGDKIFNKVETGEVGQRVKDGIEQEVKKTEEFLMAEPPVDPDRRFAFAGLKSKNANTVNYDKAIRLEKNHETRQKIYWETGFWKGRDGRWRYEIADKDAKVKMSGSAMGIAQRQGLRAGGKNVFSLGEVLDHPQLFEAYPDLNWVNVRADDIKKGHGGLHSNINLITVSQNDTAEELRTVLLHEIQHAIQAIEGFAKGGSPEVIENSRDTYNPLHFLYPKFVFAERKKIREFRDSARRIAFDNGAAEWTADEDAAPSFIQWGLTNRMFRIPNGGDAVELMNDPALVDPLSVFVKFVNDERLDSEDERYLVGKTSFDVYQALEGEVESRNVETRSEMDYKELLRTAPWRTRDPKVPENMGIVVYYDKAMDVPYAKERNSLDDFQEPESKGRRYALGPAARAALANKGGSPGASPSVTTMASRTPSGGIGAHAAAIRYTVLQDRMANGWTKLPGQNTEAAREKAREGIDRKTAFIQDRAFPLKRLVSDILKQGGIVTDLNDPAMWETLFPRRSQHRLEASVTNLFRPAKLAIQGIDATAGDLAKLGKISPAAQLEVESAHISPSHALLNIYLYARHAKERNAFIREVRQAAELDPDTGQKTGDPLESGSGMTDQEADNIITWFSSYPKLVRVRQAAAKVEAIIEHTRRTREKAGLSPKWQQVKTGLEDAVDALEKQIEQLAVTPVEGSEAAIKDLQRKLEKAKKASALVPDFKFYVPLRGQSMGNLVEDWDTQEQHLNTGKGLKIKGKEDKTMKGRQSYAGDMFANVVLQNQEAIVRAEKNAVGNAVLRLIRDNPALTKDVLVERPDVPMVRQVRDGKTILAPQQGIKEQTEFFVTKENGKDVVIEVKNPALARLLSESTSEGGRGANWIVRAVMQIGRVTRLMSRLVTSYAPEFLIPNFLRDWQSAVIQARQYDVRASALIAAKAPKFAVAGLMHTSGAKKDPAYAAKMERLSELGGLTGVMGLSTIEDQIADINKEFGYVNPVDVAAPIKMATDVAGKTIAPVFKYLENVNDAAEGATRLAVFESFVELGWSEVRAAQMAKNLTVNFNQKGEMGPIMNALFMFFNASVQGSATMLQSINSREGVKVVLGMMAAGAMMEALMSAMSPEDEYGNKSYDKIEDHILERNFVIMLGSDYVKIPLPMGWSMFFNAGRLMARSASGKDKPLETAGGLFSGVIGAFNPLGGNSPIETMWAPSVIKPIAEAVQNVDFTGQQVHPKEMPGMNKSHSQTAGQQTSKLAEGIATAISRATGGSGAYVPGQIELYPDDIDHVIAQYMGGLGRTIGRFNNLMGYAIDPQSKAVEGRDLAVRDIPFYRAFAGNVSDASIRNNYTDTITPYLAVGKNYDEYERVGNFEAADAMMDRNSNQLAVYDVASDFEKDRIKIRREIKEIQDDTSMTDVEKVSLVNLLRDEEQDLMNQALREVKALEKDLGI